MITNYNLRAVRVIGKNVEDSLRKCGINSKVEYVNNNKVIAIQDNKIILWLRLYTYGCNDKLNADISTIELSPELRRRGTFETICRRLKNCKYIDKLRITGVCTPEMNNWCKKHGLKEVNPMDYLVEF